MFDWILNFQFNSLLGVFLYWLPLGFCTYGYLISTWEDYRRDIKARDTHATYYPQLTIGDVVGRIFVAVAPVINLLAAVFDVAPTVFGRFFNWCGRVLNQPLVPDRK
jgi:hypothetical protein